MALTDQQIKKLKPASAPYKKFDGAGLYLYVPTSGARIWRYAYRFGGKPKTYIIGSYDEGVSLAAARDLHQAAHRLVRAGIDPNEARRAEAAKAETEAAAQVPFRAVAKDWLAFRWPEHHGPNAKPKPEEETNDQKGSTRSRDEDNEELLRTLIGDRPIAALTLREIAETVLDPLERRKKFEQRRRVQSTLNGIFGYAQGKGIVAANPLLGVNTAKAYTTPDNKPMAALVEPEPFGRLLRDIATYEGRGYAREALELTALTFVRPGHVADAEWSQFDLDNAMWTIPFDALKQRTQRKRRKANADDQAPHKVPLSRQALALLREVHKLTGHGHFVFPGTRHSKSLSEGTMGAALESLGYKGKHTPHGFRSSASTLLNKQLVKVAGRSVKRFDKDVIELQMDHKEDAVIRRLYDRGECMEERAEIMQFWADHIDELRDSTNVVRLKRA